MPLPKPQDLLTNPDFKALPTEEKLRVFAQYPEFKALPEAEQLKVIGQSPGRTTTPTEDNPRSLDNLYKDTVTSSPLYNHNIEAKEPDNLEALKDTLGVAIPATAMIGTGLAGSSAIANATIPGFLRGLAASYGGAAIARKGAEWLHLPGWAQTGAELIGAAAGGVSSGKLGDLLHDYVGSGGDFSLKGFLDFLVKKHAPELPLVERAVGVTGGTPVTPSASVPGSLGGPSESGPGFAGSRLSPATGQGGNSQSPSPVLVDPQGRPLGRSVVPSGAPPPQSYTATPPLPQYSIPGVGDVVERTPVGGKGTKTPAITSVPKSSGPTGVVPSAPGQVAPSEPGTSVSGVRPGYEKLAQSVVDKVVEPAYNKAVAIAKYLKTNNINPATVADRQATSTAAGYSRPINDASWQRVIDEYSKLPASDTVTPSSNNESTTPLEDTLKKSIAKAATTKAPAVPAQSATPPLPSVSAPDQSYVYDVKSPNYEFKRSSPGQWGQRDFGSSDPFAQVVPSLSSDLEDSLRSGELKPKP